MFAFYPLLSAGCRFTFGAHITVFLYIFSPKVCAMKNPSALIVPAQSFTSLQDNFFVPPFVCAACDQRACAPFLTALSTPQASVMQALSSLVHLS